MVIELQFYIRNLPNIREQHIRKINNADKDFLLIISEILKEHCQNLDLDQIAILNDEDQFLKYEEIRQKTEDVVAKFGMKFIITDRHLVQGPNLAISPEQEYEEQKLDEKKKKKKERSRSRVKPEVAKSEDIREDESFDIETPPSVSSSPDMTDSDSILTPSPPPSSPSEMKRKERERESIIETEFKKEEIEDVEELKVIETPPETQSYHKDVVIDYFSVMNPRKYYPLTVKLSDLKQQLQEEEVNLITGERRKQTQSELNLELSESVIKVRPTFPGCNVTPYEILTDFDEEYDEITFFITPLVADVLDECSIDFYTRDDMFLYSISTPTKVQDPLIARSVALYGTLASTLPKIIELFGINYLTDLSMEEIIPMITGVLGTFSLTNFIGLFGIGIIFIVSLIIYFSKKPKAAQKVVKLGDIRKKYRKARLGDILSNLKT